jgi:bifunctional enzyme CysN/CysC
VGQPPNLDFRGFAGTIAGGSVRRDRHPRAAVGARQHGQRIVTADGDLPRRSPASRSR